MVIRVGDNGGDLLNGTADKDSLFGNGGADLLFGRAGIDLLFGGDGKDIASYYDAADGVSISLKFGLGIAGEADGDILVGIEVLSGSAFNDSLEGDGQANSLYGNNGDDFVYGGAGPDALFGGAGRDIMLGGQGADSFFGGVGEDHIGFAYASGGITVNLATGIGSGGDAAGDTYSSIENVGGTDAKDVLTGSVAANTLSGENGNDTIYGGGGNDRIYGDIGNDRLFGGAGEDRIRGSDGKDVMTGGGNHDYFTFGDSAHSGVGADKRNRITDFQPDLDKLDLSEIGGLSFIGTAGFSGDGQVRYVHETGQTIVKVNLIGSSGAEMEIELDGILVLTGDSFAL